jgi:hypothetical protein
MYVFSSFPLINANVFDFLGAVVVFPRPKTQSHKVEHANSYGQKVTGKANGPKLA